MNRYLANLHGFDYYLLNTPRNIETWELTRYEAHPIINFLAKFLPIDPWVEGWKPVYEKPRLLRVGNDVFVDIEVWLEIRREAGK